MAFHTHLYAMMADVDPSGQQERKAARLLRTGNFTSQVTKWAFLFYRNFLVTCISFIW